MIRIIQAGAPRAPHPPRPAAAPKARPLPAGEGRVRGQAPFETSNPKPETPPEVPPAPVPHSALYTLHSTLPVPLPTPHSALEPQAPPAPGLGDRVEQLVKPVAATLQKLGVVNCLDQNRRLKPESPCARRRAKLNALGKKVGI